MATSDGVKVISINNNDLIVDYSILNIFDNNIVYSLEAFNESVFIASEKGLFKFNLTNDNLELISETIIYNIASDKNGAIIASNKNRIFYIKEELIYINKIKNITDLCVMNDFIWINSKRKAHLFNIKQNEIYEYDYLDGISGDLINHLDCDEDWVWFSTNNGLSIYNWSKYHINEK